MRALLGILYWLGFATGGLFFAIGSIARPSKRRLGEDVDKVARPSKRRLGEDVDMALLRARAAEGLVGDTLLFKVDRDDASADGATRVARSLGCGTPSRLFRPAGRFEDEHVEFGLDLWFRVACDGGVVRSLERFLASEDDFHGRVVAVEPEVAVAPMWTPDDPKFATQRGNYDAIRLRGAWDVTTGSSSVVVQIVDETIDLEHPDLKDNVWQNPGEICDNGVDDDDNGYVDDCHGYNFADDTGDLRVVEDGGVSRGRHGTHVAGVVGARSNNGVGVAGVAGGDGKAGSGVKLMASVIMGKKSGGSAAALVYGADMGAVASSNSWGYTDAGVYQRALLDAIDYCNAKGTVVIAAAGNADADVDQYPAFYDGVVAVAAVDDSGERASPRTTGAWGSNYGAWIDVSAPGVGIPSTVLEGAYAPLSGTSAACPHVAGVVALAASLAPSASAATLRACLVESAASVDGVNEAALAGKLGGGLVDAEAMVRCVSPSPAAPTGLAIAGLAKPHKHAVVSWKAGAPGDDATSHWTFRVDFEVRPKKRRLRGARWTTASAAPRAYHREADGRYYQPLVDVPCGARVDVKITALGFDDASTAATAKLLNKKVKC